MSARPCSSGTLGRILPRLSVSGGGRQSLVSPGLQLHHCDLCLCHHMAGSLTVCLCVSLSSFHKDIKHIGFRTHSNWLWPHTWLHLQRLNFHIRTHALGVIQFNLKHHFLSLPTPPGVGVLARTPTFQCDQQRCLRQACSVTHLGGVTLCSALTTTFPAPPNTTSLITSLLPFS